MSKKTSQSLQRSSKPCSLPVHARLHLRNPSLATRNASTTVHAHIEEPEMQAASMYQYPSPVCLLDKKGKTGRDEGSAWKAPENTTGDLKKESSIEDVLRNQIEKKEFYNLIYQSDCEIVCMHHQWRGVIRLAKDYMKFLFSGSKSARLKVSMDKWGRFYRKLTKKLYDQVEKGHYQQPEEGHNQQPDLVG